MPEADNTLTGFAEVNGGGLYYEARGHGYPLLLLHAGVADSRMWDDQVEVLARYYQVIRYDIRGFGQSAVPAGPFSHYEDAAGLLGFLGMEKAHVIGVSFGGSVAVDFTLAHPQMVASLILSAPIVSGYEPASEEMQRFFAEEEEALSRGDLAAATEVNLRMWVDGLTRTPDQVRAAVRERVREMQLQAFAVPIPEEAEEQSLTPPAITRLAEIQVPALIIAGDRDVPEFLEISEVIAAGIRDSKMFRTILCFLRSNKSASIVLFSSRGNRPSIDFESTETTGNASSILAQRVLSLSRRGPCGGKRPSERRSLLHVKKTSACLYCNTLLYSPYGCFFDTMRVNAS